MFHIIASLAEMESNLISERTRVGLAAMKAKNGGSGAGSGWPLKLSVAQQVRAEVLGGGSTFFRGV